MLKTTQLSPWRLSCVMHWSMQCRGKAAWNGILSLSYFRKVCDSMCILWTSISECREANAYGGQHMHILRNTVAFSIFSHPWKTSDWRNPRRVSSLWQESENEFYASDTDILCTVLLTWKLIGEKYKQCGACDLFLQVSIASASPGTPRFCWEDSEESYEHFQWRRENSATEIKVMLV